jgi:plastocyanin
MQLSSTVSPSSSSPAGRWLFILATLLVATALLLWGTTCTGCSDDEKPPQRTPTKIDPATTGSIKGVVLFRGTPPVRKAISTGGDPACNQTPDPLEEHVIVAERSGRQVMQNVFVWIKSGLGDFVPSVPQTPVLLDQKACIFRPHVVGVQRYQVLRFTNSDPTEHNVKFAEPGKNPPHDKTMTGAGQSLDFWFPHEQQMMKVICNKHSWMKCWVGVVDHPWFAVTGEDGTFKFEGVPPGSYTVAAWSEAYKVTETPVKLDAKATLEVDFEFTPK